MLFRTMLSEDQMFYEQGLALGARGRYPEAREALWESQRLNPLRQDAPLELARLACRYNDLDTAHQILSQTLTHHPQAAEVHLELGILFHGVGQLEYALQYYRSALRLQPALARGWLQLGRLLQQLNQTPAAEEAYRESLRLDPQAAMAWNCLGLLDYFAQRYPEARVSLSKAVGLEPDNAHYQLNLAMAWLQEPGDLELALQVFAEAVRLNPAHSAELIKLGDHLCQEGRFETARPFYACALPGLSDTYDVLVKMAQCAERECDMQAALDHYNQAMALRPDQWLLELRASLLLPMIYQSREELIAWRQRFAYNLGSLEQLVRRQRLARATQNLPFFSAAFLLAYQGFDNRLLLDRLSDFWRQLLFLPTTSRSRLRKGPRRIGVVSSHLYQHSIAGCYLELLRQLHGRGHALYAFSIGEAHADAVSAEVQQLTRWETLDPAQPLPQLAKQVLEADLDILIYPEIGLDPVTYFLAHGRLAPQQVLLLGHPHTSGIATMDAFISSALHEGPDAQSHYREKLVQLSRAPFVYAQPVRPQPVLSREALGLPEGRLYLVPGTLFKLHPDHDPIFEALLSQDPEARIVLIQPSKHSWHTHLQRRFAQTLPQWLDRLHFVPWMPREQFYSLLLQADAVLDTLHFGAGNVAYQALGLGVAPLTLPGQFLRSCTTAGLYAQLGVTDCVAHSPEELVALCLRMAQDPAWKAQIRAAVLSRASRIFDDRAIMGELVDYLEGLSPA